MTLVVFFEDSAIGDLARDRIHTLASKHPSRVIVLDGTRDPRSARVEAGDWIELGVKGCDADDAALGSRRAAPARGAAGAAVDRARHRRRSALRDAFGTRADGRLQQLAGGQRTRGAVRAGRLCGAASAASARRHRLSCGSRRGKRASLSSSTARTSKSSSTCDASRSRAAPNPRRSISRLAGQPAAMEAVLASDRCSTRHGNEIEFEIRREGEPRRISCVALSSSRSKFVAEVDKNAETIQLSVTRLQQAPADDIARSTIPASPRCSSARFCGARTIASFATRSTRRARFSHAERDRRVGSRRDARLSRSRGAGAGVGGLLRRDGGARDGGARRFSRRALRRQHAARSLRASRPGAVARRRSPGATSSSISATSAACRRTTSSPTIGWSQRALLEHVPDSAGERSPHSR